MHGISTRHTLALHAHWCLLGFRRSRTTPSNSLFKMAPCFPLQRTALAASPVQSHASLIKVPKPEATHFICSVLILFVCFIFKLFYYFIYFFCLHSHSLFCCCLSLSVFPRTRKHALIHLPLAMWPFRLAPTHFCSRRHIF